MWLYITKDYTRLFKMKKGFIHGRVNLVLMKVTFIAKYYVTIKLKLKIYFHKRKFYENIHDKPLF